MQTTYEIQFFEQSFTAIQNLFSDFKYAHNQSVLK